MKYDLNARISHFLGVLVAEEQFHQAEGLWLFSGGGQCSICTHSARRIARQFKGRVVGYYSKDNPRATIGLPTVEGHDFAVIEDRWLVDYWAWHVLRLVATPIFDLRNNADRKEVVRLYGPSLKWKPLE